MKIAVIPIDNRPICYDLIKDILAVDKNIELFMPDIKDLGGLTTSANIDNLFDFIKNLPEIDYFIISLDTLAYGGLVSSRRCEDSFEEIKTRITNFKQEISKKHCRVLAFSSIMRISNNNVNEEEKPYWDKWGKKIFDWSYNYHKNNIEKSDIPKDILYDYIKTRKRNFDINLTYLNWAKEGFFDTLVFSKDDCAEYGLNVKEGLELKNHALNNVFVKTGADEIPLSLITRALTQNKKIGIKPVFIENNINLISKYEDITVKNCVLSQLGLAGLEIGDNLTFFINNFEKEQGDLVLGDIVNETKKEVRFPNTPYFIADINNANGADNGFIEQLFKTNPNNLYSYCGYNTSANSIGCAICLAVVKYLANSYDEKAFKKIMFIRFLDDWAYQNLARKQQNPTEVLNKNTDKISAFLDFSFDKINYSFPWNRSFEIRIKL